MQIIRRIAIILVWLAGPVFIFAAVNKNDPYLISLRGPGNIVLATASIIACRGPHPPRLLEAGHRRTVAPSAVVPAVAGDARRACFV
jgi:hypothetical protein